MIRKLLVASVAVALVATAACTKKEETTTTTEETPAAASTEATTTTTIVLTLSPTIIATIFSQPASADAAKHNRSRKQAGGRGVNIRPANG